MVWGLQVLLPAKGRGRSHYRICCRRDSLFHKPDITGLPVRRNHYRIWNQADFRFGIADIPRRSPKFEPMGSSLPKYDLNWEIGNMTRC